MKITFGKYKNQELAKVYEDEWYKKWLLRESFFKTKYPDMYNFLINYEPQVLSPIKFIDNTKGIILCDDILWMIGEYFKKIPNKPIDKIKYMHRCKRCKEPQWDYSMDTNNGKAWSDSCGSCNNKDRDKFLIRRHKYHKGTKCECGKYKKSRFWTCYTCNKSNLMG